MYLTQKEAAYFAERAYGILQPVCWISPRVRMGLPISEYVPYIQVVGNAVCTFGDIQANYGLAVPVDDKPGEQPEVTCIVALFFPGTYAN